MLQQQESIAIVLSPQRTDTPERKVRRYPQKLQGNKRDVPRQFQIRPRVWTHGPTSLVVTSLTQQLNCVCDTLAKQAVTRAIIEGYNNGQAQLLPREDVALIVWGDKVTSNISGPLHFHGSKAVACKYHIHQRKKGKWTHEQFEDVDWEHLDLALKSKADNYKIWRSKQTSSFCGSRVQVSLYSGKMYPDERCPNCGARETDAHLMRCPDKDRTCLLIETVEELEKWMETDGRTDPKLIYWIPKFILMHDDKPFSQLGYMSDKMHALQQARKKMAGKTSQRATFPGTSTISSGFICQCPTIFSMTPTGPSNSSPRFSKLHTPN